MAKRFDIRRFREKVKRSSILITKPSNIFYITGVMADSTFILIEGNDIKIITNFIYFDHIKENLKENCPDGKLIMFSGADLYDHFSKRRKYYFEAGHMTYSMFEKFKDRSISLLPGGEMIEKVRSCKSEDEIDKIRKAVKITDKTFRDVIKFIKPGKTEKEVSDFIESCQKKYGASKNSFDTIAAFGENASLPHAVVSDTVIKKGKMLKMDYGARYQDYCSDMTRTVFVGKADKRFKEIYGIVLSAQLKAIDAIKPGVKAADIDKVARDYISKKGFGDRFGHSLGHGLGIDVHENPAVSSRSDKKLEEGNVITVEPGIYIPGWGGIRIEDDVVVRKDGPEILTASTKKIIEI